MMVNRKLFKGERIVKVMRLGLTRTGIAIIVVTLCLSAGCSLASRFEHSAPPPAPVAMTASGRVDSLFNSALPADTLFPAGQPSAGRLPLTPLVTPLRKGPASLEIAGQDYVMGWRVQLASSPDRKVLEDIVARVEREFGSESYLVDFDGYSALRIGAFDNLEAAGRERDRAVSYGYKNAWIVQTRIPPYQIQREE